MINIRIKFESISFFLITLQSYYFYGIGMSVFPVIGSVMLFAMGLNYARSVEHIWKFVVAFGAFHAAQILVSIVNDGNLTTIFSFMVSSFAILGFYWCFHRRLDKFLEVARVVLFIHILFFYFQAGYWLITGEYLDYLQPITGQSQRYLSEKGMMLGSIRVPRFTGLFNEPGTYSTWIYAVICLILIIKKSVDKLLIFALASMLLSLSLYGFVLTSAVTIHLLIVQRGSRWLYCLPITALLIYLWPAIDRRLNSDYSGLEFRQDALANIFNFESLACGRICSDNLNAYGMDVSVYVNLIQDGGLFYVGLFFAIIAVTGVFSSLSSLILVFVLLLTKIKLTYPLIWIIFIALYMRQRASVPQPGNLRKFEIGNAIKNKYPRQP